LFIASGLFGVIADQLGTSAVFVFLLLVVIAITFVLIRFVPEIKDKVMSIFKTNKMQK
jgi:hypothetical protein